MGITFEFRVTTRQDTAANWAAKNPILMRGEHALTIDSNGTIIGEKYGDGLKAWSDLPYKSSGGSGGASSFDELTGTLKESQLPPATITKIDNLTTSIEDTLTAVAQTNTTLAAVDTKLDNLQVETVTTMVESVQTAATTAETKSTQALDTVAVLDTKITTLETDVADAVTKATQALEQSKSSGVDGMTASLFGLTF